MGHTVVGLDIGSSGVRAAEIRLGRHQPVLRRFATAPLPEGALRAGAVVDQDAVAEVLKRLWTRGGFSTKEVTFGIANEGILVRQMDLEWMPPADFRKALRYQVAEALPVSVDEANVDYHVLEELELPGEDGGPARRMVRILLVAAAQDVVDTFVETLRQAGLRPTRADLLPFALIRVSTPRLLPGAAAEAIVDIGADTVGVTVHTGGQPRFVRMIPGLGSNRITRALQERYSWTWEEAERTKIALGLPVPDATADAEDPASDDVAIRQLIADEMTALVAEVRTTLDFARTAADAPQELTRILLAGSGSRLSGLEARLTAEFGLPVEPLAPFAGFRVRHRLKIDPDDLRGLAVPAGMCLGVSPG